MPNSKESSMYKGIKLNYAKCIAYCSSDVHRSVNYLDLSIGEYSWYRKKIAATKTGLNFGYDSMKNLAPFSKIVCPFDLELPSKNIYYDVTRVYLRPNNFEEVGKSFYVEGFCIKKDWYKKKLQGFVILSILQRKEKSPYLKKLFKFDNDAFFCFSSIGISLSYCFNILCIENGTSDIVKGIVMAMDIPEHVNDLHGVVKYFMYQNYDVKQCYLPVLVRKNIIHVLKNKIFYTFVPPLLKSGFSSLPLFGDGELVMNKELSHRRKCFLLDFKHIYSDHKMKCRQHGPSCDWMPEDACEALTLMWCCTPDALLSQKEIPFLFSQVRMELSIEEFMSAYQRVVGVIPAEPTPRSLKHYSRLVVRNAMAANMQLPHGISSLNLPPTLESYFMLEF